MMLTIEAREQRVTAYLKDLANADAEYIRQREGRGAKPATIADWQDELADRIEKHAVWHIERGETRGMQRGDGWHGLHALDALTDAVADLVATQAADDNATNAAIALTHEAVWNVKHGADHDRQHDDCERGAAWLQCKEIEESDLRQLLRCWADLELIRRAERDGQMSVAQVWMAVATILANAPGYPMEGGL